ncbi:MAG: hypothetical protein P8O03_03140 [Ilumatobacter sp.]|nr:hypothetical protein [Ilumatobacter sp.]
MSGAASSPLGLHCAGLRACDECGGERGSTTMYVEWQSWWTDDKTCRIVGIHADGDLCAECFDELEKREDSSDPHDGAHIDHACELAELAASSFSAAFGFGDALAQLDALGTQAGRG